MARKKIALIGSGMIGGTLAHLAAIREMGDIVLVDVAEGIPQGKALDLAQAGPVEGYDAKLVGTQDYADIAGADVCIVTAGVARKPGMSRDDLLGINLKVMKAVGEGIKAHAPDSFVICVTNPLDAMVWALREFSGLPHERVVGMAGVLDSARFRHLVAERLGVPPDQVDAITLGSHGDTMVPVPSLARVGGRPLVEVLDAGALAEVVQRTRDAGAEIVALLRTGSAYQAPASAAEAMVRAVVQDRDEVMPVCAWVSGQYGLDGVYLGVPARIGREGVREIVELPLTPAESAALRAAADEVRARQAQVAVSPGSGPGSA